MFLYLISFMLLFAAGGFGATYLLVRQTPYAPYSLLLSVVSFQPMLLVCLTLFGFVMSSPLKPAYLYGLVFAGIGLTSVVSLRYYVEIVAVLQAAWRPSLLIFGRTIASIVLAT